MPDSAPLHKAQQPTVDKLPAQRASHASPERASTQAPPALAQRSVDVRQRLSSQDVLYLQRAMGNRAVAQLLAGDNSPQPASPPQIQRKLAVGPVNDKYEREADAISKQIVRRSLADHVQRSTARKPQVGPEGGKVNNAIEGRIRHSSSGGSSLPKGVRGKLESSLGADLSSVKVHTDSQAADLNRQLGAKAFTHKNHIYYGAGQSPDDIQLTAHEAVHTVQQGATQIKRKSSSDLLQRVYQHPDNQKFYSHVLPKQEITTGNGVITASATGGTGGGHTVLMFEYLDNGIPANKKVDLRAGTAMSSGKQSGNKGSSVGQSTTQGTTGSDEYTSGSTGSQSSSNAGIRIDIKDASQESMDRLISSQRRSWVVSKSQINKGMTEALNLQSDMISNVGKFTYKLFGRSIFAKNPMNCASFGERVLQKAGIRASASSWWFGTKLPSTLASGENVGYTPDTNYPAPQVKSQRGRANPTDYDHIKQLVFRGVSFLDGKIIAGDVNEFDYKDTPSKLFTFTNDPQTDSELPTKIFKITVHKDIGLARLEPPVGEGVVNAAYVLLSDLFTSSGTIATA